MDSSGDRPAAVPSSDWHRLDVAEVATRLATVPATGLSRGEVGKRLDQHGANELAQGERRSPWRMFAGQFTDFMIVVLLAAAAVAGVVGEPQDSIAIVVIVVLNAVIGFVQEYRAEQTMAALRRLGAPHARVLRNGEMVDVAARELVPGDVVLLEAGNIVPADLRLVESARLKVQEAALTGESLPVEKQVLPVESAAAALGDRTNMAYKGTVVTYGRGRGIVAATGMATELGRIAALIQSAGEGQTPLQRRLAHFGKRLAIAALGICAIVFVAGLFRGEPMALMFLTAVSLAVAAIPEALPAVITVALAMGAGKMARRNALVRRLPAVEALGSVTYICTDKTGTLTQNRMCVARLWSGVAHAGPDGQVPEGEPWAQLARAIALCNDAGEGAEGELQGDPTETALYAAARDAGYVKAQLAAAWPRVMELPFDSDRKRMTTVHRVGEGHVAFTKGAPESVVDRCSRIATSDGEAAIDAPSVLAQAGRMAADGLRVLALASRRWHGLPGGDDADAIETDLMLLGLVGLIDPPREEAAAAVAECVSAGIVPVMITGDHPVTARAIATRLGILGVGETVMDGVELSGLSQDELRDAAGRTAVYARVNPEQKIRIVEALQARGEIVAMTGDGVNDAPALNRADVGVSMGRSGTDVAREASHLVLLDDNFATIVAAVREGRRIYDNVRKFIKYALTGNMGEIWTIFLAPFLGLPIPLLPIHILWVNLVTDGLPGLALAMEPGEPGLMRRPPRPPNESVFARGMWQHIAWVGLLLGGVCIAVQAWAFTTGHGHWQTMVFTVLSLSQLGLALALRSERESLFALGLGSNLPLAGTIVFTVLLQLAVIYVPWLNGIFHTKPLSADELAICLALSCVVFVAVEMEKALIRAGVLYPER
ncbi:MAG: cation-translocating P-type ATPase [Betaproteobacteria bacterium]|nr:cation-translocating P-type ATPase [Betaproteobacteria bacterium]